MKKIVSKAKSIIKANLEPLPVDEVWYQSRIAICETCPLNSKGIPDEKLKFSRRLVRDTVCLGGPLCDGCGCCIDRKASMKESVCGMVELPVDDPRRTPPKWGAIKSTSEVDSKLTIENLDPENITLQLAENRFVFNADKVTKPVVNFKFRLTRPGGLKVINFKIGCGCTVAEQEVIDENTIEFSINISTSRFTKGVSILKTVTINYSEGDNSNKERQALINFKMIKT